MTKHIRSDTLRRYRREKGFTQDEFAELLGFKSRTHYSRVERGTRSMNAEQLMRASVMLNEPLATVAPKTWQLALNGLWEDIQVLAAKCLPATRKSAHCDFLTEAERQVELLEHKTARA